MANREIGKSAGRKGWAHQRFALPTELKTERSVKAMKWQRIALAVFVVAFLALAGRSCIQRTKVFTTEPSTVIRNPDRFSNKTVILSGQVISALSIGGVGFYLLQDEKGSAITVATQRETPDVGAILRVKGRVRKALQIGAASVIGVEEWERKQIGFDEVKKPMKVLSIGQIRDEAIKYNGQPVLVQGKVVEGADILGAGYFIITDGKEVLTIITSSGSPRIGSLVQVFGVYNRLAFMQGQTIDCLIEIERKAKDWEERAPSQQM